MAFCKFSTENRRTGEVMVDSVFFTDYMPSAPESCTKVYLYGLSMCQNPEDLANNINSFAEALNLNVEDVKSAFLYWQEENLVTILNLNPIEVRYLPIRAKKFDGKIFKKEKYADFNNAIQEVLDGRMITPHEYKEYYLTMESLHIDAGAMLMIAKYCTEQKGASVGYAYILTVAKNWAYEGIHTATDVEKKLDQMEELSLKVKDVLTALKSKKNPSFEDKELYQKWTKQFGFDDATLIFVAKSMKKGSMDKMAVAVENYAKLKLFGKDEIAEYEKHKDELYNSAKIVCKSLGLFYESLDPVVNTYILKWQQMGYDFDAIKFVAEICFKKYIRTFDGMDEIISKYYANGLVSLDAIEEYVRGTLSTDKKIKMILEKLGLSRQVTSWDRDFYHTWTYSWNFDEEMIDYAISLSVGKSQPMTYLNKILSNWKEQKIDTLDKAKEKKDCGQTAKAETSPQSQFTTHSFSAEELNALFDNLDEVKLI